MLAQYVLFLAAAGAVLAQESTTATTATETATSSGFQTITEAFPTATLLLPANVTSGFAGTLIHAAACETTYRAFDIIAAIYSTSADLTKFVSGSCSLINLSSAACATFFSSESAGSTVTRSVTTTLTGNQLQYAQIPITAGGARMTEGAACEETGAAVSARESSAGGSGASEGNDTTALQVGVGVGVGVGVALLAGAIAGFLLYRRHARKKAKAASAASHPEDSKQPPPPAYDTSSPGTPMTMMSPLSPSSPHELQSAPFGGDSMVHGAGELPAPEKRFEMGGEATGKVQRAESERFELESPGKGW